MCACFPHGAHASQSYRIIGSKTLRHWGLQMVSLSSRTEVHRTASTSMCMPPQGILQVPLSVRRVHHVGSDKAGRCTGCDFSGIDSAMGAHAGCPTWRCPS